MAVVKLAVLFSGGHLDHSDGSDAMTNRNVPLRGIADSTKRESAPPAQGREDSMEKPSEKELAIVREYLRKRGVDPDKAPALLEYLRKHRVTFWPRFIELAFAGIGMYCLGRFLIRLLLGV
jgi:hypothetical protein